MSSSFRLNIGSIVLMWRSIIAISLVGYWYATLDLYHLIFSAYLKGSGELKFRVDLEA